MVFLPILIFFVLLGALIFVHEYGHFLAAKRAGVEVLEFGFGFPPRLFSWKRGRTRYSINTLPFGGFVKLFGEDEEGKGPHSFRGATVGRRLLIVLAGVLMNVLLGIAVLSTGFSIGMAPIASSPEVLGGAQEKQVIILSVLDGSPADEAGLKGGDILVSFDSISSLQQYTRSHQGQDVFLTVRDGETRTLAISLRDDPEAPLGVQVASLTTVKLPLQEAIVAAVKETGAIIRSLSTFVVGFFTNLATRQEVSEQAVGPVGLFVITEKAVEFGLSYVLQLVALLSINLAVINILPFPALDGGRAVFLVAEGIFGKRVLKPKFEGWIHAVGFALLVVLLLVLTYRDIVRFF